MTIKIKTKKGKKKKQKNPKPDGCPGEPISANSFVNVIDRIANDDRFDRDTKVMMFEQILSKSDGDDEVFEIIVEKCLDLFPVNVDQVQGGSDQQQPGTITIEKAIRFVKHIEQHLKEMNIEGEVCCKICDKTISEIFEDVQQQPPEDMQEKSWLRIDLNPESPEDPDPKDQMQLGDQEQKERLGLKHTIEEWREISKEQDERIERLHEKAKEHLAELIACDPDEKITELDLDTAEKWDTFFKGLDAIENNQRKIKENLDLMDQQFKDRHKKFPGEAPLHQAGDKDLVEQEIKDGSILIKESTEDIMMICLEKKNGSCPGGTCSAYYPHKKTYKCQNCCDKSHCVPFDDSGEAPGGLQESEPEKGGVVGLEEKDVQQQPPEDLQGEDK